MLRRSRTRLFGLLLLLSALGPVRPAAAELSCATLPEFAHLFLRNHVQHNQLSAEVEKRALENYVLRLDRSRMLLTRAEAEALKTKLAGTFAEIEAGRCTKLTEVHREFVRKHEASAKFVRKIVEAEDYAIDETASLVLDPDERGYPESTAARDDLMLRMIHFQMSNYVSNDTPLDDAKRKLIKRYERRFKRELDVSTDEVYAAFLDSFASALDPHSNYLSQRVLEDFRIGMSLSLEGIGVALSEQDGYAVAERIIPGGAAEKHGGLQEQDKLIAVAEGGDEFVDIIDMPLRDSVSMIRGKAGTKVGLTVLREDGDELRKFNIEIVRAKIDLAEQAAQLRFEERDVDGRSFKLAILELPSFYGDADPTKRQCTDDVKRLLGEVKAAKADGLLLDLSRNGGGLLQHAVEISGYFIREGEVVGIQDARGHRQILSDSDDAVLYAGPLVVHTSRVSASASEILAGALKDYGRAVIVGDDHTFGKGTVQTVSQLPGENGALKVTTALFFRPGGHSTQHSGVDADVVLPSLLASDDYGEKTQRYSLPPQQTSPFLGDDANSADQASRWEPVGSDVMMILAKRSARRVAGDDDFTEILERLTEQQESGGVVKLADILKRREENGDDAETEETGEKEATPQLQEAMRVLTDLVALSVQQPQPASAQEKAARPES
ncbi:MAG: PDZ domain-containing protein [Deltaproteobacteria bacterium]|nr:PDZ domain-containing protein [Deltaproteobacteria bacterium]MBW2360055.1 PDZ domain-containing protein [Deltaproteobacteria bacterium]